MTRQAHTSARGRTSVSNESGKRTETELRDAMKRLLAGRPLRGSSELTVTNLAQEAGVSRATANRYPDVLQEYRLALQAREVAPTPPDEREALRRLEERYRSDRASWSAREAELEGTVAKYAQQIQFLSVLTESLQASGEGRPKSAATTRVLPMKPNR